MKQMTIAEIKGLDHKMPVPSFVGTIDEVYEQKTGVGEYGPWFLQNLMVSDQTGSVTVTWGGEDPFDQGCKGKTYSFECSESKHGLRGVSWERRKKDGKTYESVKVTQSAKIKILGARSSRAEEPPNGKTHPEDSGSTPDAHIDPDWPEAPPIAPQSPVARPKSPDVQRAIIRQHSQSMALKVLELKGNIGQLTLEDLTPFKLKSLAEYFDQDVFGAAS